MEKSVRLEINNLLEETTRFDFPVFSDLDKKKKILNENREYVENELKRISGERYPTQDILNEIWEKSVKYADEQFESLPKAKRLNGFYLQELMHYYVESLGEMIL